MAIELESIVKQLSESSIIAPGKLENFVPPKATPASADELIGELVKSGEITAFQATQIKACKAKALILGEYTILDKIGAGGMGQVFKAVHRRMERLVAIKLLPPAMTKDAAALARFQREVKAAAKLSHQNVVAAYDAGQAGPAHFLVMEYVEGKDLSATVKKRGPLPIAKAVNYMLQAARGLEFAHRKGVIHRDIKPANLLLDSEETVKILDMGLARIEVAGAAQAELTGTGAIMGTVDYMAPEQGMSTKHADARADIYSLGCSLFYLITGRATYGGETVAAKLVAHHTHPIPNLREACPAVPEQLDIVFKKMVAKSVDDRYQNMTEVIADLDRCHTALVQESQSTATGIWQPTANTSAAEVSIAIGHQKPKAPDLGMPEPVVVVQTSAGRKPPGKKNRTWLYAAGGAALVLVLLEVIVTIYNNQGEKVAEVVATDGTKITPPPGGSVVINTTSPATAVPGAAAPGTTPNKSVATTSTAAEIFTSPDYEWSEPEELTITGGNPSITADGLTLVFNKYKDGERHNDLWIAERKAIGEPFGKPSVIAGEVNTAHNESNPSLSPDGLTIWFNSDRPDGLGGSDIWRTKRRSKLDAFGPPVNLGPPIDTALQDGGMTVTADGLIALLNSNRPGTLGGMDLWQSRRSDLAAAWQPPVNLGPSVNTGKNQDDLRPWISGDGRVLYFSTTDVEPGSRKPTGNNRIWTAARASIDVPFGDKKEVVFPGLKGSSPTLSGDGRLLIFQTLTTVDGKIIYKLWQSRRVLKPKTAAVNYELDLSGTVDAATFASVALPPREINDSITVEMFATARKMQPSGKFNGALLQASPINLKVSGPGWQWLVDTGQKKAEYVTQSIEFGRRVHLAGVLDCQAKLLRLYVDGRLVGSKPITAELPAAERRIWLGRAGGAGDGTWSPFDGTIDEVRITHGARYDKDFTPQERFEPDAQTWGLYHCDEGSGDVLVDASGNGRNGKIVGATWIRSSPPPPGAVAPFDAKQARAHQEAWAKHLGTSVETVNSVGMRMNLIPPGEFLMGSTPEQNAAGKKMAEDENMSATDIYFGRLPAELPQHTVTISQPFLIASTEVTIGQFKKFVEASHYVTEAEQHGIGNSHSKTLDDKVKEADKGKNWRSPGYEVTDESPVSQVTWNDARAFCAWLTQIETSGDREGAVAAGPLTDVRGSSIVYRLPTEAEWEYACRAGTTTQFSFGDDLSPLLQHCWYSRNARDKAQPVALKRPNGFGLYDIHGNVQEWCQDFFDAKWYEGSLPNDPQGPVSGSARVIRGGGWHGYASVGRSASRYRNTPSFRFNDIGFRIVRTLDNAKPEATPSTTAKPVALPTEPTKP